MDCREAREHILEGLADDTATQHIDSCVQCRRFRETQAELDRQLSASISQPSLSPRFRAMLMKKIRAESSAAWPDFLPDVAHLAGGLGATLACLLIVPFGAGQVIAAGAAFTVGTYLLQCVVRDALENWEERP
jgi:hypothetical protein